MGSSIVRVTANEFKKNFMQRYILWIFTLLLGLNILLIYNNFMNGDYSQEYFVVRNDSYELYHNFYEQLHQKIDGELTDIKVKFINSELKRLEYKINTQTYNTEFSQNAYTGYEYADFIVLRTYFYLPLQFITNYQKENKIIVEKTEDNIQFFLEKNNPYEVCKNNYILKEFANRRIDSFYETHTWDKLFNDDSASYVIALMIILGILPIVIRDSSSNMEVLILTTTKGRFSMTIGRIISILLYVLFLCIIVLGLNYLTYKFLYGLNGGNMPLYSVEKYAYSPLNCSLNNFYLKLFILKFIGFYGIALSAVVKLVVACPKICIS